jgi:GT2 family glycosyltransferase
MAPEPPLVSIIVPCRNEAKHLPRSLGSLVAQDYPAERLEVIVVDGMSEDDSADIARDVLASAALTGRVVSNPDRVTPVAFNIGLEQSTGDVVIIVSAHCELSPDYVRVAVATLERTGADCVGGPMQTTGETPVARAIALALSSAFGVGASTFRTRADYSGFVDTVPFGAYRREVFERVGTFDPAFIRNQDAELNFRLTRAGGRIWLESKLRSVYYSRATLAALWRQHFHTGESKVGILAKHRSVPRLGHYIPGAFVGAVAVSVVAAIALQQPLFALAVIGPYTVVAVAVSAWASRKQPRLFHYVVAAMPTLHFSYGLGFLYGIGRFAARRPSQDARAWGEPRRRSTRS